MRKFTPIPIVIMVIASIVLASGVLFPDTPTLPRLPTGSGTIGGVLSSLFAPDGTARNTNMLSGVSASGYLHNTDCTTQPLNKVWVGIDADGRGICGNVAKLIAILTEQSTNVTVSRDGGLTYSSVPNGTFLYEGDLINSDASGTGMIRFTEDNSLIRFAPNTDLQLEYGSLGANTVAEVILNNGRLWGRILSATGVNLGGGGLVTGVRGTSVDIKKTLGGVYTINTVSSANTTNSMYDRTVTVTKLYQIVSGAMNYGSGILITYMSGAPGYASTKSIQLSAISYGDPWVRTNTFLDVDYLSSLLVNPMLTPTQLTQINKELDSTLVQGNNDVTTALLDEADIPDANDRIAAALLLDIETAGDNKNNAKALKCKLKGYTYFPTIPSNTEGSYCNGSWNTHWTTMDLMSTGVLNMYGSTGGTYTTVTGSTNAIDSMGEYLHYDLTGPQLASLLGKTLKIELDEYVPTPGNMTIKHYVLDTGTYKVYKDHTNKFYYQNCPSSCSGPQWLSSISGSDTSLKIVLPSSVSMTPNKLVIGANKPGSYFSPINATIKRVFIY